MLKLEAGKRYWMRYGGVSGVLLRDYAEGAGSYAAFTDGVNKWDCNGRRSCAETEADLVREYTEPQPQPLEWKRGIPTEEECRECWIVPGGRLVTPTAMGCLHSPESIHKSHYLMREDGGWYIAVRIKPVEPPKPKTKTVTLQQLTHPSGDKRWIVVEDCEMVGCWTATDKIKTVEVPCE